MKKTLAIEHGKAIVHDIDDKRYIFVPWGEQVVAELHVTRFTMPAGGGKPEDRRLIFYAGADVGLDWLALLRHQGARAFLARLQNIGFVI